MTDPAEPLPEDRDNAPSPSPPPSPADASSGASDSSADETVAPASDVGKPQDSSFAADTDQEGLPEWEPLTPELVEDEAIRGDFMLRWAVILLAVLMGWTVVQESEVLTHIRAGDVLVADGFLPSGRDSLASTTQNVRWVHLDWLFDAGLSGLFAVLGETGLTLLKVLLAAVTFYLLSRISLPGVPTWWGSVCAALALVACFPSLTATPHIVTLLGTSLLLLLLHRHSVNTDARLAGPVVATMLVWSQLDNRAWIGGVVLLAWALGHQWDLRRGVAGDGSLLPVALSGLLVMLVHPFLWETWVSAYRLYATDYPAQQVYAISGAADHFRAFALWSPEFWTLNYFNGAGLLLWFVTLVVLALNAARVCTAHLALFVVSSLLATAGGTELAMASIVFAAIATLNAQQWYVAGFRQSYSVETRELLFSRGGRALTVIALFGLGFLMVAGHLTGAAGRRVGTGFSRELRQSIDSYAAVLEDSAGDRPFSFRPAQGDLLNWTGRHPFVDSRLRLFATGTPSIIDEHLQARAALRIPRDGSPPQRQIWQTIFDKYDIKQAVPRLSGAVPDYVTFYDLLNSPDWALVKLGADTAAFCRTDKSDPDLAAYVQEHRQSDLVQTQLRPPEADVVSQFRTLWPSPPSVYSRYFYRPKPDASGALQRARHYLALGEGFSSSDQAVAALYAALRDVHRGLADHPSEAVGYLIQGQAYSMLWTYERELMQARQRSYPAALRYAQTVSAYHQAIVCQPGDALPHMRLLSLYAQRQRHDLALRHLQEFQRITGQLTSLSKSDPRFAAEQQQMQDYLSQLTSQVSQQRTQRDEDVAAGMDPSAAAARLVQAGFPLTALEVIESDLTQLSANPELGYLYARLLLECGRTRDAYDQFQSLKAVADVGRLPDWTIYEAISDVIAEDLPAALETLTAQQLAISASTTIALLSGHPLQAAIRRDLTQPIDPLVPVAQRLQLAAVYFDQLQPQIDANYLTQAQLQLELGRNAEAAELLHKMLQNNPLCGLRPVAEAYLKLLQENPDIPEAPDVEAEAIEIPDLTLADAEQNPEASQNPPATSSDKTLDDTGKSPPDAPGPDQPPSDTGESEDAPPDKSSGNDSSGETSGEDAAEQEPATD